LIFESIEVEPRNFIYADERNPFDPGAVPAE